ncbi:MAG: DUF2110 family protein [Candidatus Helarchaeota archaeon]
MKTITILEKSYGSYKTAALKFFQQSLSDELQGLEVQINRISLTPHQWITIELEGEDEEAAYNFLSHKYERIVSFSDLEVNQIRRGRLIQTGKYGFGLFIDIGINSSKTIDAFLPLYRLREQLTPDEKFPLRNIVTLFGFLDNLSLSVQIESLDRLTRKVQVALAAAQLATFKEWVRSKFERLIVTGVTRHHLKKILVKSGHFRDIVAIERLGFLEEMVICKRGTNAPGILSEIGRLLPNTRIQLFIPSKIQPYFR